MKKAARLSTAFGKVLRRHRIGQGMTQERLAEAASMHHTYVSMVERGLTNLTVEAARRLSAALGSSLSTLIVEAERVAGLEPPQPRKQRGA